MGIILLIVHTAHAGDICTVDTVIPSQKRSKELCDRAVVLTGVKILPEVSVKHIIDLTGRELGIKAQSVGEPRLVFLHRKQQEHTVIVLPGAHAPVVEELIGIVVAVHSLKIIDSDDNYLCALTLRLKSAVKVNYHLLCVIGEHLRIVGTVEAVALPHECKCGYRKGKAQNKRREKRKKPFFHIYSNVSGSLVPVTEMKKFIGKPLISFKNSCTVSL